jgi:N-formylglutamate amidohydrolase
VPHSSRTIPPDVRQRIDLGDDDLARELALMTDAYTDRIAGQAAAQASSRPWLFVNRISRLVIDPERFPDEREPMRRVGMGAVYTRTSAGVRLRRDDPSAERELLQNWYVPYARAMTALVDDRLTAVGGVTIIDVHSYPSRRLPYELGGERRPAVCIGTHPAHTPERLLTAAREALVECGKVELNTPFEGCYLPLKHLGTEPRLTALMVEIRRDVYMDEPGGPPTAGIATVNRGLTALIDAVARIASAQA